MEGDIQGLKKRIAMTMMRRKRKKRRPTGTATLTIKAIIIPTRVELGEGVIMETHRKPIAITHFARGSPLRTLSNSKGKSTRSRCS